MSESSVKGKSLELEVAKTLRKKLGVKVSRDSRSGAGIINKSDISDWYSELSNLFLEVKNHKAVKIREWFRQADGNASVGQAPTVVFAVDVEILACLRFSDLVDFLVEIKDQKAEIDDLRRPLTTKEKILQDFNVPPLIPGGVTQSECRNGHISDAYGYCQQKGCKYSRGYKLSKKKGGKK